MTMPDRLQDLRSLASALLPGSSERHRPEDIDEAALVVEPREQTAVGVPAVTHAMEHGLVQMGPVRTAQTLLGINQPDGFDCMSCAWADPAPGERSHFEFCENGAKAVAAEATRRRVRPELFQQHTVADLALHDDHWLSGQGRLTEPLFKDAGSEHYVPVSWDEAFSIIADQLAGLESPDQATFYTSGRTSNEAAFLYQLFVRGFGTNNLPDCSNMCHESSGTALTDTIGIGKGSVSLEDLEQASLVFVVGQNPGTNHPRMLSALEKVKRSGGTIVAVNPLPEAGLIRYRNPQKVRGILGSGTAMADHHLQIRLGGDQALFRGFGKVLLEAERNGESSPGLETVFDHGFIGEHTTGFEDWLAVVENEPWSAIEEATGIPEQRIREVGRLLLSSDRTVVSWAMGLTQHRHSVVTIKEVVNVILAQGNIGRTGAGLLPVRGHSNVQGDRTMGIFERMPARFHDALDARFAFQSPREHGHDVVDSIRGMRDGRIRFFMGMGGNFVKAAPDSAVTEAALESCELTVQISTKLNHSHFLTGRKALILPTLGRTDRDLQAGGPQRVTVEDSMSMVHSSQGRLEPPSEELLSEVAIVSRLAQKVLCDAEGRPKPGTPQIDWVAAMNDYRTIREHIESVVPGFENFEERIEVPGGFKLPHGPQDSREFTTEDTKAHFTASELDWIRVPDGCLILQTLRSHDQYNTTVYSEDDRYRGIHGGRRVVFVSRADCLELGLQDGQFVDLVSVWKDGADRRAPRFRVVEYDTVKGSAAAYYPETNVLVPLDSQAIGSGTPASKSVVVRLELSETQEPLAPYAATPVSR
ncbi:FdhF/YdeP family oxidoreductase [Arthrobacter sp. NPDC090010]|uniref:FdhF/YdeP family oxidoreductase n=1 Tax=Arthrobacter sp. NPDC090010 TaxID=3363942 RepID=UPI0038263981